MNTIQITNITVDELTERIVARLPDAGKQKAPVPNVIGMINVLNKRNAARTLNISESLFDKFYTMGLIPCTVNAGSGKKGDPVRRWAEHHLLLIKPIIQDVRYAHYDDKDITRIKLNVRNTLGL